MAGEMQYCGCSFVFDLRTPPLVFTGASLQRCMREILIARGRMRRLFEVSDWFNTKTTRSGVAQCGLSKRFRFFRSLPFSWKTMRVPSFRRTILQNDCKENSCESGSRALNKRLGHLKEVWSLEVLSRTRSGAPWALIGHERTTKNRQFAFRAFNWKFSQGVHF
ncbi:hypothetical protein PAPYR_10690 [Paratrimastix pyriformis]|uniref:Uncharacterized protein n=1 Tax=Paratrimastix pyriformis TaxID=342808 RepID=A0ABQ8U5E0_9EUKA|nr:hypothetical protein PAPYR_10690 [Paratrimastix pyriformis]